jgi:cytochrome P450
MAVPRLPWDAANPYPFYERRRRDGDIVWDETAQSWLVLGYDTALQVLSQPGWTVDPLASPSAPTVRESINPEVFGRSMLNTDGAAHRRLRAATRDVFAPSFITGLTAGVEGIAETLIDDPITGIAFNFMSEIAQPMTLAVLAEWLGLDAESSRFLSEKTHEISPMARALPTVEDFATGTAASAKLVAHLLPLAASRRAHPGDDLLSFLASDPELLLDEVVVTTVNISVGALENTSDFLGSATARLLTPDAHGARPIDTLDVSDPTLITELFRLESPQATTRTATEAQQIDGVDIARGQQVLIILAAANRDPAVFDEPDQFQLGRRGPAPLTFGRGEHFCIGRALAQMEADVVLRRVFARDPVLLGPVTWRDTPSRRAPLSLPIAFQAPRDRKNTP